MLHSLGIALHYLAWDIDFISKDIRKYVEAYCKDCDDCECSVSLHKDLVIFKYNVYYDGSHKLCCRVYKSAIGWRSE